MAKLRQKIIAALVVAAGGAILALVSSQTPLSIIGWVLMCCGLMAICYLLGIQHREQTPTKPLFGLSFQRGLIVSGVVAALGAMAFALGLRGSIVLSTLGGALLGFGFAGLAMFLGRGTLPDEGDAGPTPVPDAKPTEVPDAKPDVEPVAEAVDAGAIATATTSAVSAAHTISPTPTAAVDAQAIPTAAPSGGAEAQTRDVPATQPDNAGELETPAVPEPAGAATPEAEDAAEDTAPEADAENDGKPQPDSDPEPEPEPKPTDVDLKPRRADRRRAAAEAARVTELAAGLHSPKPMMPTGNKEEKKRR